MEQVSTLNPEEYCKTYLQSKYDAMPVCHRCGTKNLSVEYIGEKEGSTHYGRVVCLTCTRRVGYTVQFNTWWIPAPGNNGKTKKASTWISRDYYRQQNGGQLKCWLCEVMENRTSSAFDIHHIDWLEEKGSDFASPQETRPLCKPCHQLLTNLKKNLVGHTNGITRIDTAICGINGAYCSSSIECNHHDCENCESRIEVA